MRIKALVFLTLFFVSMASIALAKKPSYDCGDEISHVSWSQTISDIRSLEPELKEIALSKGWALDDQICRGASGTLADLLKMRFNLVAEPVFNGFHTLLRIQNFYGNGKALYIDSSYRQFLWKNPAASVEPYIFVGPENEMEALLIKYGRDDLAKRYFKYLRPDELISWL